MGEEMICCSLQKQKKQKTTNKQNMVEGKPEKRADGEQGH